MRLRWKGDESKGTEIVRDKILNRLSDAVDVLGMGKHAARNGDARKHAKMVLV